MAENLTLRMGLDWSGVRSGLAQVRGELQNQSRALNTSFAHGLGSVLAGAGIGAILDKADKIKDLADRFGLLGSTIQRIGNVAQQNGSSFDGVASSLNKLIINQDKVRKGDAQLAASLKALGIDAQEFVQLGVEDAFFLISDAVAGASDRQVAYAAVLDLMGRSAGELFSTLELGAETIREMGEAMGVFADETLEKLADAADAFAFLGNRIAVFVAEVLVPLELLVRKTAAWGAAWYATITGNKELLRGAADVISELNQPPPPRPKPGGRGRVDFEAKEGAKGSTDEERRQGRIAGLRERLAEQQRRAIAEQLEGEEKINELIRQRDTLIKEAAGEKDEEKRLALQLRFAELDSQIFVARKRADEEAQREAGKAQRGERPAQRELVAGQLTLIGLGGAALIRTADPGERSARSLSAIERRAATMDETLKQIEKQGATPQWGP